MSKQVDPKKPIDSKAQAQAKPAQAAQAKPAQAAPAKPAQAAPAKAADTKAAVQAKPAQAAPAKAADAKAGIQAKPAQAAPAKAADAKAAAQAEAPKKSAIHSEIDKIVVDATKSYEHKKTTKTEIVSEVKELKITGEDKKSYNALVVYLPFVYTKNHKGLLAKIVNEIQTKKKLPAFIVTQRTMIHGKSDFKQKIPRNRTLTSVYDSILEDLISPGIIIGKRARYHLDGSQHIKIFLNDESKGYLENKTALIAQIYKQLTNRKVSFEFRHEPNYIRVPILKAPRAKVAKKGAAVAGGAKKEGTQAAAQ